MDLASKLAEFVLRCGATAYAEPPDNLAFHRSVAQQVFQRVLKSIPPEKRVKVLDVGCADGFALKMFGEAGYKTYKGVTSRLEDVPDDLWSAGTQFCFQQADMHEIALWPKGIFSLVWARHIVEHSPIPLFLLEALRDQLTPDGFLYVEVPSPSTPSEHFRNANHYSCFGQEGWWSLFHKAGLEVVDPFDCHVDVPAGKDVYFCFLLKSVSRQEDSIEGA